jgi:hypothetical protein
LPDIAIGPTGKCSVSLILWSREYELITEAHAQLSVIRNCSRSSLTMSGGGETASGGAGVVSRAGVGGGGGYSTQGERIWSSLGQQTVKRGLLLIIHILLAWLRAAGKEVVLLLVAQNIYL